MDPNGGKENLFNKLSKQDCIKNLQEEKFDRVTLSFYKYVQLKDLEEFRDDLYVKWIGLNVLGRIYLSVEGINAQLSVPTDSLEKFKSMVNNYNGFEDIKFKIALEDNKKSFYKLVIKIREQIVSDGLSFNEYDITNVGNHLTAKEWNKAIDNGALVIDMRNHYESEIGKFKGAVCPEVETFKEQLPIVKDLLNGKEDDNVLLYCTGGIRCEKASSYLKHHGFKNVNQLHGGIIDYVRQINKDKDIENKFIGKNFVFDERRGERVSDDVISKCHQCGESYDTHVNCRNVNCNLLFLQCGKCKIKYQNCCSIDCIEVVNLPEDQQKKLRKGIENKKIYYSHKKVKLNLN
tara:strand:- start:809 stop:1852 length:1044 start_codon:yes stop_codon:yes gene_type:complete